MIVQQNNSALHLSSYFGQQHCRDNFATLVQQLYTILLQSKVNAKTSAYICAITVRNEIKSGSSVDYLYKIYNWSLSSPKIDAVTLMRPFHGNL